MCDREELQLPGPRPSIICYHTPYLAHTSNTSILRTCATAWNEGNGGGHWEDAGYPECRIHDNTTSWHGVLATIRWLGCCAIRRCDLRPRVNRIWILCILSIGAKILQLLDIWSVLLYRQTVLFWVSLAKLHWGVDLVPANTTRTGCEGGLRRSTEGIEGVHTEYMDK